jgi:hypothetical protein
MRYQLMQHCPGHPHHNVTRYVATSCAGFDS